MSDRLTDEEIEEIRGREKKAPGEKWEARCEYDDEWMVGEEDKLGWGVYFFGQTEEFTQFVAHARTDIPRLLDEVERMRAQIDVINDHRKDQQDTIRHVIEERDRYRKTLEAIATADAKRHDIGNLIDLSIDALEPTDE